MPETRSRTIPEVLRETKAGQWTLAAVISGGAGLAWKVWQQRAVTFEDITLAVTLVSAAFALIRARQAKSGHTVPVDK